MTRTNTVVYLAADHAGFALKEDIRRYLTKLSYNVTDLGAFDDQPSDYPDFIIPAAQAVSEAKGRAVGIFIGGSGIGECIAANKVRGIRAALVFDGYTARITREHNDSNVLCLGARTAVGEAKTAKRLVKIWLSTPFSGAERHRRRLEKIADFER